MHLSLLEIDIIEGMQHIFIVKASLGSRHRRYHLFKLTT